MVIEKTGDILASTAAALVNPVNTRGVMGKGLALQVKQTYPSVFTEYAAACKRGQVVVGKIHVVPLPSTPSSPFASQSQSKTSGRWMVNFPTKDHWRGRSRIEWIEDGMEDLVAWIAESGVRSVALPKLGCANGKLRWDEVKPVMMMALGKLDKEVQIELYV